MTTININDKEIAVDQFQDDWALALMSQGVIAKLHLERWRATARLTPETLGLKFVDDSCYKFVNQYIELGQQKLLPPKILKEIAFVENKARRVLNNHSFDTVWGKFVPFKAFEQWTAENELVKQEYMNIAVVLSSQYDAIIVSVKNEYKKLANDVWIRLYNNTNPTSSFIESFSSRMIEKIPPREDILTSFKYSVSYLIIPMPSFVEENIAQAERIKRQEEMNIFSSELEKQTKQKISEEYIKRKKELIDGFLEATVISMRKTVSDLCDDVLASIGKCPDRAFKNSHINKLKDMIKKIKVLNFYDDQEIEKLLNGLETELDRFKGETNPDIVTNKLKEISVVSKKRFVPKNFNPAISVLEV